MAVSYLIDKTRRLVVTTCRDHLTFAQLQASQAQLLNDPDFNPDFNHLIDTSAITQLDVSMDEARMIASRGIFSPASRGAFVAPDPAIFGMGRMMATHHDIAKLGDEVGIFRDLEAALKWLGLDSLPR